jgi:hypothetical protein
MTNIQTTKLNDGTVVLAKPDGSAFHYMNDSQAARKVTDLFLDGINAHIDFTQGRVAYIVID